MVGQAVRITDGGLGFRAQNTLFNSVVGFRVYVNVSNALRWIRKSCMTMSTLHLGNYSAKAY